MPVTEESRFTKKNFQELDEELDDSGLPKFKTVLLCGPPGLGKTTLAHLIAQHAGNNYNFKKENEWGFHL